MGVATSDVEAGERVVGIFMDDDSQVEIEALAAIRARSQDRDRGDRAGRRGARVRHPHRRRYRRPAGRRLRARPQHQDQAVVERCPRPSGATGARTGASACATTSSSCRSTTCPTRPARPSRNNIKGTMAIPHPYGRLQFGADLDLHFRTLIGTGANPNVAAVVVIGIEDQWTKRVVDGIAATGKPVTGFGIELHGDHDTIMRGVREGAGVPAVGEREAARASASCRSCGCRPSAASRTRRPGCGANPTVGDAFDKLYAKGPRWCSARRPSSPAARPRCRRAAATTRCARDFMRMFDRYQEMINAHKTSDLLRLAAHQGQHRGRAHDDRGEGARQHPEDRQASASSTACSTRPRCRRTPGLWFMDSSSAAAEMVTLCAARRLRRPLLPDRARATSSATRSCR